MKTVNAIGRQGGKTATTRFLLLLLWALPGTALAQFTYTTNNGAVTITGYICGDGPVIIAGLTVKSIGDWAFSRCAGVTSVTIPSSVTNIGSLAFYGCTGLLGITVDPFNPAYSSLDGVLFNKNQNTLLQYPSGKSGSYTVPNGVISIGDSAFSGCAELSTVTIPDSVTSIGNLAFSGCTGLTSVVIPYSVTNIGSLAFYGCTGLSGITVDPFNLAYSSLEGVLFKTIQRTLLQYPLGKSGSYTVPNSVISIGDSAFSGCTGLTTVAISNSVTNLGFFAFSDCTGLTSVNIPNSVISIGNSAFSRCTGLTNVTIPNSVTSVGREAFANSTGLTGITVDALNPAYSSLEGVLFNKSQSTLLQYPLGKSGCYTVPDSVTSIEDLALSSCTGLTSVVIPYSVTNIGFWAFAGCTSLAGITVDALNPAYSSLEGVLFNKLQRMLLQYPARKIGNYTITSSVISIGDSAFSGCTGLTSVTIPNSVTNIGLSAFSDCAGLTGITVDALNPAYSSLEGVLFNRNQSTLLQYPAGKTGSYTMPNGVTNIGVCGFYGCTGLSTVTISDGVASIGSYAFFRCTGLTGIYFRSNAPFVWYSLEGATNSTVYYLPGKEGWGATLDGRPTALWRPRAQNRDPSFGAQTNQFGFNICWAAGMTVVVEASTDLAGPGWISLQTNILTGGSLYFSDSGWTNHPARFYRLRWPYETGRQAPAGTAGGKGISCAN